MPDVGLFFGQALSAFHESGELTRKHFLFGFERLDRLRHLLHFGLPLLNVYHFYFERTGRWSSENVNSGKILLRIVTASAWICEFSLLHGNPKNPKTGTCFTVQLLG
jgi:hypothetical protein